MKCPGKEKRSACVDDYGQSETDLKETRRTVCPRMMRIMMTDQLMLLLHTEDTDTER